MCSTPFGERCRQQVFRGRLNIWVCYWVPWYLYLAFIFFLSSIPRPDRAFGIEIKDFLLHPVEYFTLPILTFRAFKKSTYTLLSQRFFTIGILFCVLYAASDEFHQLFVHHRSGSVQDVIYDLIGVAIGATLYFLCRMRKSQESDGYLST